MKVLLISTPRAPTLNIGSNGLGRHVYDFISKLVEKKDDITVIAHPDSKFEWEIEKYGFKNEITYVESVLELIKKEKYDVIVDNTHHKRLSTVCGSDYPVLNFIHDEECPYMPPNTLLGNVKQQNKYPKGIVKKTGIIFKNYPLITEDKKEGYFSFCGKLEHRKGYDIALEAAKKAKVEIIFAGPDLTGIGHTLPKWLGEIRDHKIFCNFVGKSKGLYYPSRSDAGGMGIWEAAALGTPTLTTTQSGAECNVINEKTGFVASSMEDLVKYTELINNEQPCAESIRENAKAVWDLDTNFEEIYSLINELANGKRW